LKTRVTIYLSYIVEDSDSNLNKADDLYRSFQSQFKVRYPNAKLNGVHIEKHGIVPAEEKVESPATDNK
jgi:hypothetical protein